MTSLAESERVCNPCKLAFWSGAATAIPMRACAICGAMYCIHKLERFGDHVSICADCAEGAARVADTGGPA